MLRMKWSRGWQNSPGLESTVLKVMKLQSKLLSSHSPLTMLKSSGDWQPEDNTSNNKNGKSISKPTRKLLKDSMTLRSSLIRCKPQSTASSPLRLKRANAVATFTTRLFNCLTTVTTRPSLVVRLTCTQLVSQRILSGKTDTSQVSKDSSGPSLYASFSWVFLSALSFLSTPVRRLH